MESIRRARRPAPPRANVRDLEAMKRFYVDLLGFAVEWEPDADNVYLSSGIDNLALHRAARRRRPRPGRRALGRSITWG